MKLRALTLMLLVMLTGYLAGFLLAGCSQRPLDLCQPWPADKSYTCPEGMKIECVCQNRFCHWGCKPKH